MTWKFFSDTNVDGFVQSIALFGGEVVVSHETGEVTVSPINDRIADLADAWGGVVINA